MYEKQNFYSGQPLKASQLSAMEDGIIEAQGAVREICYEDNAYEPITWDGKMEGREYFDFSSAEGEEPGTVYAVKISDVILTSEDFVGSTLSWSDGELEHIEEDWLIPPEASIEWGIYGISLMCSVFDTTKASIATGVTWPSTGTYVQHWPSEGYYLAKLSKTVVKKIDEKFLPELASGANMEKGSGTNATQQLPHLEKMTTQDEIVGFDTGSKNGYVNGFYPYGATGPYSVTLNGRSSAQGEYSLSANSQTVAPGNYATSLGYATVAGGDCSLAGGSGTYAAAEGSVALGMKTKAGAAYAVSTGSNTQALADCAIAGGVETIAKGEYSVSLGKGTIASYAGQTILGTYNKLDENNEAVKTILTVASGINHETYGIQRDDAFRILDNRAVLFFPIKSDEQDVNVEPICLQDVVTMVGQALDDLYQTTSNLSSTDSGLQAQIGDLQRDIQHISSIVTDLQTRVAKLESK